MSHVLCRLLAGIEPDDWAMEGLCTSRGQFILRSVAEKGCNDSSISVAYAPYEAPGGESCGPWSCIGGNRDALCDAEQYLASLAAAAADVEARVLQERGGISRSSVWRRGGIGGTAWRGGRGRRGERWTPLARSTRRCGCSSPSWPAQLPTCCVQDALRDRVRATHEDQSSWWHLAWNDARETVALAFVTPSWRTRMPCCRGRWSG